MTNRSLVPEITVVELKQRLETGSAPIVLDVREPHELEIAALPAVLSPVHIPLGQLEARLSELTKFKNDEIVVYCRSGGRSLMAADFLIQNGYAQAKNLKGGVLAWSAEVDPSVPRY